MSSERVVVRSAIAPLMAAARVSSGQTSQLLRGHEADVLEEDGVWLRIRGADGYDGWCHRGYLQAATPAASPVASAWSAERRMSLGCRVKRTDGLEVRLPLGGLLEPDDDVTLGIAMNHRARSRYFPGGDGASIGARGLELFAGTPYQWGGVTPWGADCSGFVQTIFALHGALLPRDAWMQAERGLPIAAEATDLQAGDLLFFSDREDGRVTHVAISLAGAAVVHSSLANGGVATNSMSGDDPVAANLRTTYRFARRVL